MDSFADQTNFKTLQHNPDSAGQTTNHNSINRLHRRNTPPTSDLTETDMRLARIFLRLDKKTNTFQLSSGIYSPSANKCQSKRMIVVRFRGKLYLSGTYEEKLHFGECLSRTVYEFRSSSVFPRRAPFSFEPFFDRDNSSTLWQNRYATDCHVTFTALRNRKDITLKETLKKKKSKLIPLQFDPGQQRSINHHRSQSVDNNLHFTSSDWLNTLCRAASQCFAVCHTQ